MTPSGWSELSTLLGLCPILPGGLDGGELPLASLAAIELSGWRDMSAAMGVCPILHSGLEGGLLPLVLCSRVSLLLGSCDDFAVL